MPSRSRPAAASRAQALFEHYAFHARFGGDDEPKRAAVSAKRTATSLGVAVKTFGALLTVEQLEVLRSAVTAMRDLASDLDSACVLARRAKLDYDTQQKSQRERQADEVARDRWHGDDEAMLNEAADLAAFIDTWHELDIAVWMRERLRPGFTHSYLPDTLEAGGRLLDMLHRFRQPATRSSTVPQVPSVIAVRRRAAEYLHSLMKGMTGQRSYKTDYFAALDDYEAWRAWRASIRSSVVPALPR